jgi:hypothetical protein
MMRGWLWAIGFAAATAAHAQVAAPVAAQTLMEFAQPMDLNALPPGWRHRTFWRHRPMQASWVSHAGRAAIRLATQGSASMLYRDVDVSLDRESALTWGWLIEQPVVSEIDELTADGDDHPARLYLKFMARDGQAHAMEIIWGNRKLATGDWKYLKSFWRSQAFPHYTARGGQANVGRWHDERVDMRALYRAQWGDPAGVRLVEIALFCDTDQTGASSIAYFSTIRAEPSGH